MPTFDYICLKCQTKFEKTVPFAFKGKLTCPKCQSGSTQKLLSTPGIIFKGKGFYKTDNPNKSSSGKTNSQTASPKKEHPCKDCPACKNK